MDRAVRIQGTRVRIGLDALLGLVPIGGDAVNRSGSNRARAHGASPRPRSSSIAVRKMSNVLIGV
jgi:hypothetical protein